MAARETDLYPPIKAYLEGQGYAVKGEVQGCDVVACRGDEVPVVVELKRRFSLDLVLQAVERQKLTDKVYVAVEDGGGRGSTLRRRYRAVLRLCRMLGLGLLLVRPATNGAGSARVEARLDPVPYKPRQNKRKRERLLQEFDHRVGDPNTGGSSGRWIMTAYRQDALRCADLLALQGPLKLATLREQSGVERAAKILQRDVFGWFERRERGVYEISPKGREALETHQEVVAKLRQPATGSG